MITSRSLLKAGLPVSVIQKQDQREKGLTSGIVESILTNSESHHQGIKVRLTNGIVGRVAKINKDNSETVLGRENIREEAMDGPRKLLMSDFMPAEESRWTCIACTFLNRVEYLTCEMCLNIRN